MKEKIIGFLLLCGMMTLLSTASAVELAKPNCLVLKSVGHRMKCLDEVRRIENRNRILPTYKMKCVHVFDDVFHPSIKRCENEEVICYLAKRGDGNSLQCKFKEKQ